MLELYSEFLEFDPRPKSKIVHSLKSPNKTAVEIYRVDAVVIRSFDPGNLPESPNRGSVGETPSAASLQRLVFVLNNADCGFRSMLTMTMTPSVHRRHTVDQHKQALKAALERCRRKGMRNYVWVREHQGNGSVHWHVFLDTSVGQPGEVNDQESRSWSRWFAKYYGRLNADSRCVFKMMNGNFKDFVGCCRIEELKTDAAGLYASKEGAKRFQKQPPSKWRKGGNWWRASSGVRCTPLDVIEVDPDSLSEASVEIQGQTVSIPYKLQYGFGLKNKES